jgi:hypothetical protein
MELKRHVHYACTKNSNTNKSINIAFVAFCAIVLIQPSCLSLLNLHVCKFFMTLFAHTSWIKKLRINAAAHNGDWQNLVLPYMDMIIFPVCSYIHNDALNKKRAFNRYSNEWKCISGECPFSSMVFTRVKWVGPRTFEAQLSWKEKFRACHPRQLDKRQLVHRRINCVNKPTNILHSVIVSGTSARET